MTIKHPFIITPRLAPGLCIQDAHSCAWLSFDDGEFVLDLPDGSKHVITDFRAPACGGHTLQESFTAILSFLGACAESRQYATRKGKGPMSGENSDLFPAHVGKWAESMSDELGMLVCEIEENDDDLITD